MTLTTDISKFEIMDPTISFGVADREEDQLGRLKVVSERYEKEGYLDGVDTHKTNLKLFSLVKEGGWDLLKAELSEEGIACFHEKGLIIIESPNEGRFYLDKYSWNSIPFVAKRGDEYLGSARIIMSNRYGLPTLIDPNIQISEEYRQRVSNSQAEFSQFAVNKGSPSGVSVGLLRETHLFCRNFLGLDHWIATIDDRVVKLLNSNYFHFGIPQIGPAVYYLGSLSIPVLVNFEDALTNAEMHESSKNMARFIRGEDNVPGFEWYQGF